MPYFCNVTSLLISHICSSGDMSQGFSVMPCLARTTRFTVDTPLKALPNGSYDTSVTWVRSKLLPHICTYLRKVKSLVFYYLYAILCSGIQYFSTCFIVCSIFPPPCGNIIPPPQKCLWPQPPGGKGTQSMLFLLILGFGHLPPFIFFSCCSHHWRIFT